MFYLATKLPKQAMLKAKTRNWGLKVGFFRHHLFAEFAGTRKNRYGLIFPKI